MNYTSSSWFPLKNFTKSPVHGDWSVGPTHFNSFKDIITGKTIKKYSTVFWNREKHNATLTLETYQNIIKSGDQEGLKKLKELELPTDIKVY